MNIDWTLLAILAAPVITLFIGAILDRVLAKKAKLIAYFGHVSAFQLKNPPGTGVHTHSVVIKNTGRKSATDIHVRHKVLPENFTVFPDVQYSENALPGGGKEIVIPSLIPGEQVSISYLYYPPLTFDQIHSAIRHSEDFAKYLDVLPSPQPAKWQIRLAAILMFIGTVAIIYGIVDLLRWWLSSRQAM